MSLVHETELQSADHASVTSSLTLEDREDILILYNYGVNYLQKPRL